MDSEGMTDFTDPVGDAADQAAQRGDWRIEGDEQANRMLFALRRRMRALDRIRALADDERERIARWEAEQANPLEGQIEAIESALASYHEFVFGRDSKAKTLQFPNGTLVSRATPNHDSEPYAIEFTDVKAFRAWAKEQGWDVDGKQPEPPFAPGKARELLYREGVAEVTVLGPEESYDMALGATGEFVPGVVAVPRPPRSYDVKLPIDVEDGES